VDPALESEQRASLAARKSSRDAASVAASLRAIGDAARGDGPLLESIVDALRDRVSLGEICTALRDSWGIWRPPAA
jgi:methylmalonyl-CoA mutase N-terminal domain/subunit